MKLNIKIMKILINGKDTAELSTCCRWSVRDGALFNENTHRFEGVNGDVITFTKENGEKYEGTVIGYTCYQIVCTKESGNMVLSAKEALSVEIGHRSVVELLEDDDPVIEEPDKEYENVANQKEISKFRYVLERFFDEYINIPFRYYGLATVIALFLAIGIIALFEFLF